MEDQRTIPDILSNCIEGSNIPFTFHQTDQPEGQTLKALDMAPIAKIEYFRVLPRVRVPSTSTQHTSGLTTL